MRKQIYTHFLAIYRQYIDFSSSKVTTRFCSQLYISLSDLRWSENPNGFDEDFFPSRFVASGVLETFQKHQESIPGSILMRSYAPVFFSTLIFSSQNIVYKGKFCFPKGNLKCAVIFSVGLFKMIFRDEKMRVEKKTGVQLPIKIEPGIVS